jgi:hypothetical protein
MQWMYIAIAGVVLMMQSLPEDKTGGAPFDQHLHISQYTLNPAAFV